MGVYWDILELVNALFGLCVANLFEQHFLGFYCKLLLYMYGVCRFPF